MMILSRSRLWQPSISSRNLSRWLLYRRTTSPSILEQVGRKILGVLDFFFAVSSTYFTMVRPQKALKGLLVSHHFILCLPSQRFFRAGIYCESDTIRCSRHWAMLHWSSSGFQLSCSCESP